MFNLFYGKTVSSITASLSAIVDELKVHASDKLAETVKHEAEMTAAKQAMTEAHSEVEKATAAAAKIASLLQ